MTPEQQTLIDAAAEALYEADRTRHVNTRSTWPKWKDAPDDVKDPYRSVVTIPVTVALRAAVTAVHYLEALEENGPTYRRAFDDGTSAAEDAISSLIPAQEKTNDT